jgi:hypothetical protein
VTIVVNLVGGPGAGKSTNAALVFGNLKLRGVNCELVTEFAKDLVWEDRLNCLDDQLYILAKQHHRLWRLRDKVDVVVTDCPLFLSVYYGAHRSAAFKALALEAFHSFENATFFLERVKAYNPAGRVQSEEKARTIDQELWSLLAKHSVDFETVTADVTAPTRIVDLVLERLAQLNR